MVNLQEDNDLENTVKISARRFEESPFISRVDDKRSSNEGFLRSRALGGCSVYVKYRSLLDSDFLSMQISIRGGSNERDENALTVNP